MTIDDYSTSVQMLADYPDLRVTAIRYRLARLLGTEVEGAAAIKPETVALVERWHVLQRSEGNRRAITARQSGCRPIARRHQMRAAKRHEAAR